jgi:hypothetical protein
MAYGDGVITPKGYRRIMRAGRYVMEHVAVWEAANGPVPAGHDIHHINGVKLDNTLSNLQLVTKLEHKRIHSGCELRNGVWWKPCHDCGEMKPVDRDHWYFLQGDRPMSICKPCQVARAVAAKRLRRARAAADA